MLLLDNWLGLKTLGLSHPGTKRCEVTGGIAKMRINKGFTLVELLVVITIIGILIVALVPVVKGVQARAKEAAVKTHCASIEASLANYAQSHNGNYPGVALDVMAPWTDHALGDPDLYMVGSQTLAPAVGEMVNGVMGGYGYYNNTSTNVFEQIKNVKDTALSGGEDTARYFDVLIAADAIQEYPHNPFVTSPTTGERVRMRNIFTFAFDVRDGATGFDPINDFSPLVVDTGSAMYACSLYVQRGGGGWTPGTDPFDTTRVFINDHFPLGLPVSSFDPLTFDQACVFGVGKNNLTGTEYDDYFAPGDFAYVPVLSTSQYAFGDSAATLENEAYKWGTNVTGYLLFGYGAKTHKNREFEDEQREFVATGLPGYGDPGVDTMYESYVLQLFEGAVYFNKNI